jgi:hypothetical protein
MLPISLNTHGSAYWKHSIDQRQIITFLIITSNIQTKIRTLFRNVLINDTNGCVYRDLSRVSSEIDSIGVL